MPVNGWMGLAFDLRPSRESDPDLDERRELTQLRRAVVVARHGGSHPALPGGAADLRRVAVEAQQSMLLHAIRTGDLVLIRRAGRTLRVGDFAGDPGAIEGLLGVLRDTRSGDGELLDAARQVAALLPAAAAG
jgi:hypothetical protein